MDIHKTKLYGFFMLLNITLESGRFKVVPLIDEFSFGIARSIRVFFNNRFRIEINYFSSGSSFHKMFKSYLDLH